MRKFVIKSSASGYNKGNVDFDGFVEDVLNELYSRGFDVAMREDNISDWLDGEVPSTVADESTYSDLVKSKADFCESFFTEETSEPSSKDLYDFSGLEVAQLEQRGGTLIDDTHASYKGLVITETLRDFHTSDGKTYRQASFGGPTESFDNFLSFLDKKVLNNSRRSIKSARGEVSDSTRQLVRDILDQVPSLVKVPAKQQGIKKEPYSSDHVCYFYTEEGPRKGSFVTVEFHVDPNDLYSEVYVTTRASFAAAADGDEARQDEREVTLDQITIEDLEDYSLADIDRIDRAVSKGFEGAQKFDSKVASSRAMRCKLFSSRHKAFVASGKRRAINSSSESSSERDRWYNLGFRAALEGKTSEANPFKHGKPGTALAKVSADWIKGFDDGCQVPPGQEELALSALDDYEVIDSSKRISSSEDTDKYYFRDNFDGTEETDLSYDELKELVLDQLNPNTQFYKDVESGEVDIFDIEWDMIGGDFEGVDYGSMEDYEPEE